MCIRDRFVLIDNCDAFVNSVLFKSNTLDSQKMISFIKVTMDNLLKNNPCVRQALLTGMLPVTGNGFPFYRNNIECYYFLDDHQFCKYYGLTSDKLEKVLDKVVTDNEEKSKLKSKIIDFYDGYIIKNQTHQVYSIWPILQNVYRKEVRHYWCNHEYIEYLKPAFRISEIRKNLLALVVGCYVRLFTSYALSAADILEVNKLITSNKIEGNSPSIHTFFLLLYHFGYLSIYKVDGSGFVLLEIPNKAIRSELMKTLCGYDVLSNL